MKLFASILAAATLSVFSQQAAFAAPDSAYPNKPVKVVVGYAPGGSSDAVARLVASRLSEKLGQTFVVENRPGAASNIAATTVARSPNDGYTILLGSNASTINVSLYKDLPFDFQKDFAPVALLTRFPNIMVVNNTVPVKTVQEFISYAKANPKGIFFASSGAGSSTRLSAELFKMMTGVEMEHVQYKGSAPALTDLMAGRIQVMFDTAPSVMPLIQGGKLRALGRHQRQHPAFRARDPHHRRQRQGLRDDLLVCAVRARRHARGHRRKAEQGSQRDPGREGHPGEARRHGRHARLAARPRNCASTSPPKSPSTPKWSRPLAQPWTKPSYHARFHRFAVHGNQYVRSAAPPRWMTSPTGAITPLAPIHPR
jgi:tripartite-type tricarboxylate transporter receptor subunit TctC